MLVSVENMVYNGVDLSDEFNDLSDHQNRYFIINDVSGRDSYSPELTVLSATLMDGGYTSHRRLKPRQIDVILTLKGSSYDDMHKRVERLIEVLNTDGEDVPISFDDESNRTYYGQVTSMVEIEARSRVLKLALVITCTDPYKYGDIDEKDIGDDVSEMNLGRASTPPIFTLTATDNATFAMISNGDEYILIGEPADDDVQVINAKPLIMKLEDMSGWNSGGVVSDSRFPKVTGTMQHDGTGMRPDLYGTGDAIHGPGVIKELSESLEDFEINTIFDIISDRNEDNFRMEVDLFDEGMNPLGMMGIKDNNRFKNLRVGLARVGEYRGGGKSNGYLIGEDSYIHEFGNNTTIKMSFKRVGNVFTVTIGRWYARRLVETLSESYIDIDEMYLGKLKYIQVLIGSFSDRAKPARLRLNALDVYKLERVTVDQTPYIIYPNDEIVFNHINNEILINGEDRGDLLNFGSTFFDLHKGSNSLTISPENTFNSKITYTEKYL